MWVPALTALGLLCGCTTNAQRRAIDSAAIQKEVIQEVERICALPPAERAAELEKINKGSGIVLQCGKD